MDANYKTCFVDMGDHQNHVHQAATIIRVHVPDNPYNDLKHVVSWEFEHLS